MYLILVRDRWRDAEQLPFRHSSKPFNDENLSFGSLFHDLPSRNADIRLEATIYTGTVPYHENRADLLRIRPVSNLTR